MKRFKVFTFMIVMTSLVMAEDGNRHYTDETVNEIAVHDKDKDSDSYGKISAALMDKVYSSQWRRGSTIFRPGAQNQSFYLPVRIFLDKDYFQNDSVAQQLTAAVGFQPMGEPNDQSVTGVILGMNLLKLNNIAGILAVVPPSVAEISPDLTPEPTLIKRENPSYLQHAGVFEAWEKWGKGKGVKIGIIDGGFITVPTLIQAGILPADKIHVRSPFPQEMNAQYGYGTGVHGAAVAEVIHEIAPEAELYLYPTMVIPEMWSKAIDMAIEDGVHIINSSLNSSLGILDGMGEPNKFIDKAIEAGIVYVNSAGNMGSSCYIAPFQDPDRNGFHNFSVGDEGNTIFLEKGENVTISLLWNDFGSNPNLPNADQDLDLYLFYVDPQTHKMIKVAESEGEQRGETDRLSSPTERLTLPPEGAPFSGNYSIMIRAHRIDINRDVNMRLIAGAADPNASPPNIYKKLQYISRQMTMTKPADHPDVITVAACGIDGNIHPYSGTGPTALKKSLKPDITGYAGVLTASEGAFWGTSCAAPFVAGCAGLLWQKYPNADDVKKELIARAVNPSNTGIDGHDTSSGWGIVHLKEPDPSVPKSEFVSISHVEDIMNDDTTIGLNMVSVISSEYAQHDKLYVTMYFEEDSKTVKAIDGSIYKNESGDLTISNYVVPSTSRKSAFEIWMLVPTGLLDVLNPETIAYMKIEDDKQHTLDRVKIGTVGKLLQ